MDFPRSSWAAPSSVSAALSAPLSSRLARKALIFQRRKVGAGGAGGDDGDLPRRRNLGLTTMAHRRRFLARRAVSSSNSDEPAIAGASGKHLDTSRLVDEKSSRKEQRRLDEDEYHQRPSFFTAVAAAALVASSSLSSPFFFFSFPPPPPAQASAGGDALITFNKRADAAADAVAGALLGALPKMKSSSSNLSSSSLSSSSSKAAAAAAAEEEAAEREAAAAAALLKEVRDVVALNYLDTRSESGKGASSSSSAGDNGNFDLAAWDAAVEAELTGGGGGGLGGGLPLFGSAAKNSGKKNNNRLKDVPAARRAARRLLAFSLSDPYSRFLSPEEFAAMARYDITGVGLNLGSADEYERKVGERPPGAHATAAGKESSSSSSSSSSESPSSSPLPQQRNDSPGVWVIGVIRGSPAAAAGVQQGDRIVAVQGKEVDFSKESAFDVASRIQGAGVAQAKEEKEEEQEEKGGGGGREEATAAAAAATKKSKTSTTTTKSLFSSFPLLSSSSSKGSSSTRRLSLDVLRRSDGSRARVEMEAPVTPAAVSPVSSRLVEVAADKGKKGKGGGREGAKEKVGVVKLDSFNARARSDAAAAVSELLGRGATSFVLDLRGNRGGLVSEGAEVAALFLEKGSTVATTLGRAPLIDDNGSVSSSSSSSSEPIPQRTATTKTRTTTRTLSTTATPLVPPRAARLTVLVDERTASAGEIVAGALRDNCRAPLVAVAPKNTTPSLSAAAAKRTYGKGLIQSVYELGDGSGLVLTVGKYFTPRGTDLDREGLVPDLEVVAAAGAAGSGFGGVGVPSREDAEAVLDACLRGRAGGGGG